MLEIKGWFNVEISLVFNTGYDVGFANEQLSGTECPKPCFVRCS